MLDDRPLNDLMTIVGADLSDHSARQWLRGAIRMIPHVIKAKAQAKPKGQENSNLEDLAKAAEKLRKAFDAVGIASRARIYEGARSSLALADILAEDMTSPDGEIFKGMLVALKNAARSAKQDVTSGARQDEGADAAVDLLAGFVIRFGKCRLSNKAEGPFHRLVVSAFAMATGDERDLTKSISRVIKRRGTELPKIS